MEFIGLLWLTDIKPGVCFHAVGGQMALRLFSNELKSEHEVLYKVGVNKSLKTRLLQGKRRM